MFELSRRSTNQLATCHEDIITIIETSIMTSEMDFGVSEGHRSDEDQARYFAAGKSKCDGVTTKSKHQTYPSLAIDVYAYVNGKASWDNVDLAYLAGHIKAVAKMLFISGKVTHRLRWGGNWDMDGIILYDQKFDDLPHFELVS